MSKCRLAGLVLLYLILALDLAYTVGARYPYWHTILVSLAELAAMYLMVARAVGAANRRLQWVDIDGRFCLVYLHLADCAILIPSFFAACGAVASLRDLAR